MKKIALFVIAIFMGTMTFAQLHLGIKAGVTMNKLTTNIDDVVEAAKTGYQLGAFVRVGEKLHLQPEVYFTAKPGHIEFTTPSLTDPDKKVNVLQDITFTSFDIPILVGYRLIKLPGGNIRIQGGPVASIITNTKMTVSRDGVEVPEQDYPNDFKDFNWAAQFGAGVDFLFLTVDLRYEMGLNNMFDNSDNTGEDSTYKNNVFFLSVGWKIF